MPRPRSFAGRSKRELSPHKHQLQIARIVQEGLLPPPLTSLPDLEVAARFLPSRGVGGDFYDYFPIGASSLGAYLGDVQGKGLEAAMYALLVSGLMRGLNKTGNNPSPSSTPSIAASASAMSPASSVASATQSLTAPPANSFSPMLAFRSRSFSATALPSPCVSPARPSVCSTPASSTR